VKAATYIFIGMAIATFLIALALNIYFDYIDRGRNNDKL